MWSPWMGAAGYSLKQITVGLKRCHEQQNLEELVSQMDDVNVLLHLSAGVWKGLQPGLQAPRTETELQERSRDGGGV